MTAALPAPGGDPVFAAFCAAGLWPGLGRRTAAELPAAGITRPDDVTADALRDGMSFGVQPHAGDGAG